MAIRVGINGLGRIGKGIVSAWVERNFEGLDIVMINDKTEAASFAHLLKYDSVHGRLHADLRAEGDSVVIGGSKKIVLYSSSSPEEIPWEAHGVNVVLECTGKFTSKAMAEKHLRGSVRKVIISAPSKDPDITLVIGVNDKTYDSKKHHIISNASCTTNCLAPVVKILSDHFGIERGFMTTVHSYTNDQKILDKYHKDLRRARAGGLSMIPTTTGAAKAIGLVVPEVAGKLDGLAVRVPTANVSLIDLVVELKKSTTKEEVNHLFQRMAEKDYRGILTTSHEPLVSVDFNGSWESAIVDLLLTNVIDEKFLKVLAWYDNETAFSHRMLDIAILIGKHLN
ncbi:MAG: type I glyceraldehyde-3-phosphate dehydrogenase [Deltaproteobacteria bacterium]|nr:type I glyceraldehyde-3-phosphate dehydrogenase [Deltaproteobacteria bacterium]